MTPIRYEHAIREYELFRDGGAFESFTPSPPSEYDILYFWRAAWQRLGSKRTAEARTCNEVEYIERRCRLADARIGRWMKAQDELNPPTK